MVGVGRFHWSRDAWRFVPRVTRLQCSDPGGVWRRDVVPWHRDAADCPCVLSLAGPSLGLSGAKVLDPPEN